MGGADETPFARGGTPSPRRAGGARVLVVDDSPGIRSYLADLLELRGYRVDTAEDGRSALALLEAGAAPDVVLLDVMMPGQDGLATLRQVHELRPELPVVMLSVVGQARTIVEAMEGGASDYLNKPIDEDELEATLRSVLRRRLLEDERRALRERVTDPDAAIWESPALRSIRSMIDQIADTDVTVLVTGESGTGKEIVARALHRASSRRCRAFVKVNCAALPAELLESELFGYERGAFTGAAGRKQGRFELAHGGTIFLDEIGEMSPPLQAKLLQVLQESAFTRLGSNREIRVDVRVVCATHRDLHQMVREGHFREDLYYRLNVVKIAIPPLRERPEDLRRLVEVFLDRYSAHYRRPRPSLSPVLWRALEAHRFPGNVRELGNLMQRLVLLGDEAAVLEALRPEGAATGDRLGELLRELEESAGALPLREVGRRAALEAERQIIEQALVRTGWNRKQAARLLGVSYKTILQKIRECELSPGRGA